MSSAAGSRLSGGAFTIGITALIMAGATVKLAAQDNAAPEVPAVLPRGGLQIRSVSAYGVYYSHALPNGGAQPGAANLPSDVGLGGSTVFEWTKFTERSTFSLTYTPSYTAQVRFSSLDALNHAFSLNATRKFAPRWTFAFSAGADYSSQEYSLFSSGTLGNALSVPSTFNDLASALLSAKFTNNPQLGVALTNASLVESPLRNLLYGERMFASSAHVSFTYSYSPRLFFTFSGGGGRTQHVSDDQNLANANSYLIPNTTSGTASAAVSYALSPLSQLGGSISTSRTSSTLQDVYVTTTEANFGRTFGRRWIVQLHGGIGVTKPVRQSYFVISTAPRPSAGGSLAFKTFSQSLIGSISRTVSDSYGLGAAASSSADAGWRWRRPGNTWWLESGVGWQQLSGNALAHTSGWHASAGFGRAIGAHLALLTQYVYSDYSGLLEKSTYSLSQSAVRVSLSWSPHPAGAQ